MNRIEKITQPIREILLPIVGEISAKTYFSYYGLFKNGLMFALYKEQKCYLKLAQQDIAQATAIAGVTPLSDTRISQSERYFLLPDTLLNNLQQYADWFKHSLTEIKQTKQQTYHRHKQKIRALPNMSFQFEKLLKWIDIYTIEELKAKGEIAVFVEFIKIGIEADHITLFKLYGALHKQLIYTIPPKVKLQLLQDANESLYAAGLRRRFRIKD